METAERGVKGCRHRDTGFPYSRKMLVDQSMNAHTYGRGTRGVDR